MRTIFIKVRNTHFTVEVINNNKNLIIENMIRPLTSKKMVYDKFRRKNIFVDDKEFFVKDGNKYTFIIGVLKKFMLKLRDIGVSRETISIQYDKHFPVEPLELELSEDYQPRPGQLLYINEIIKSDASDVSLVDMQTGGGKGYLTTYALSKFNMRTMFLLLPKYVDKWIIELQDYLVLDRDDIYVVKGRDSLLKLMTMDVVDYSFIILSITTMTNYIRDWNKDKTLFPVSPYDFVQYLKVGTVVNDEAHQHFHAVYNAMLYFNPPKVIGLSATLVSNDKNISNIYDSMYGPKARISNLIKYNKYIIAYASKYRLVDIRNIQYKRTQGYNHNLYEQSIMKNSVLLNEYLDMIYYYIEKDYITRRTSGEKLLVFVASIRMATLLYYKLKSKYKYLDVKRYVEDDPYENIITADISITTYGSAGVGLDIPKLVSVLDTTSVGSKQSNIQAAGRLREIKGRDVIYRYLYCSDIPNQVKLHKLRYDALLDKVKYYNYDVYNNTLKIK